MTWMRLDIQLQLHEKSFEDLDAIYKCLLILEKSCDMNKLILTK